MTALVRIGLVVLLALAPALCCCNARWVTSWGAARPTGAPAPTNPAPACPHCCHVEIPADTPATPPPSAPGHPDPHCIFCDGQNAVTLPESQPRPEPPAFAGVWLPVPAFLAAFPAHPADSTRVTPPERAGVDARSAALFDRHVMRC